MLKRLKSWFAKQPEAPPADTEALRVEFRQRYHNFRLLLSANNKALEAMATIEKVLASGEAFGMSFVRSHCTAAAVSVMGMINRMEALAPGKYTELNPAFERIQAAINAILDGSKDLAEQPMIIGLDRLDRDMADLAGSKMANLGELKGALGLRVPEGFVVTAGAFYRFMAGNGLQTEINRLFQTTDTDSVEQIYSLSAKVQQLIIQAPLPSELVTALEDAWDRMVQRCGRPVTAALRSSALGEDAAGCSFAGQYRSELNVSRENLLHAYKTVVASKYSLPAINYRLARGFRDEDIAMSVGCLAMVDAVAGGVIYTGSPVDPSDRNITINAAWGLPKLVVDGSDVCDVTVVSRQPPLPVVRQQVGAKQRKFVCLPEEGVCRLELTGPERETPAIDETLARRLAEIALRIEAHYGPAQDIEWAVDASGSVYLLQCRPMPAPPTPAHSVVRVPEFSDRLLAGGGVTASPGAGCGPVFKATRAVDLLNFPTGGIMVVRQALPQWASALNRAAAVVSEQGGFAGHLANVAREFAIPALFGIEGIFDRLADSQVLTVDADGQAIYEGRVEALLQRRPAPKPGIKGSPIYRVLEAAGGHILPLHLLDPGSPDFKPANCRSLHDITRFIHEKSVHEMFNFGKTHHFAERSSKQLFYKVPMQWWILNLDDGFTHEISGKYVRLEDIASVPMLAFWEGFAAIAWSGPPPLDGKGFLSVMFQSTTNPALTTGKRSKYADRNYFMISKNYCNLNSRLGYHFSIMEALVSERDAENYVSFQFKGGAADAQRRVLRVGFVGELLEHYGFTVAIEEDNLRARVEGLAMAPMRDRLKILGYLTLHTRQLDMIMSNPASVNYYRTKMISDIDGIVTGAVATQTAA